MTIEPFATFTHKPGIGLALGGGIGRGWAHIGTLRRLLELGFEPDMIAGTSVGALVGGCYLAGKLDALEDWARSLTRRRMAGYFDLMLRGNAIIGGKKLAQILDSHLGDTLIEDLPKPFMAVTGEIATGHEIWLRNGNLREAIEASYSLPGVFPPKKVQGRHLVDGAIVNPLPISVCRAMGARVVIGVGLHGDAFSNNAETWRERFDDVAPPLAEAPQPKQRNSERQIMRRIFSGPGERTPGVSDMMLGSFNILMDRMTRARLAGDPADILLTPKVGHFSLMDFDKADDLIRLGREAVDQQLPQIEHALNLLR